MTESGNNQINPKLKGPSQNADFARELNALVELAKSGQRNDSEFYNPNDAWIVGRMNVLQDLDADKQASILELANKMEEEISVANSAGKAAKTVWPEIVFRLDSGGLAFFSQLGVARRPDLTQYYVDGFARNRDALSFSEENQSLFAEVLGYVNSYLDEHFKKGDAVIQTDRMIGDEPSRSFRARQILVGDRYLQLPYCWRQLTFEQPADQRGKAPHIMEVSLPDWLDDLGMPQELKQRIQQSGITQLVFKAPTKGLSLHLGFDYVGEHKMGPLSIGMFLAKQAGGLAVQAALSIARAKDLNGDLENTALVTLGPSLHGKSTLTIMIDFKESELGTLLGLEANPDEGVYPMNDDIVLLQRISQPLKVVRGGKDVTIPYGIDGTENNFYAVPFGLAREDDPITFDVVRGTDKSPNPQETMENVPIHVSDNSPDFLRNPVRNMRMILSRERLLKRKGVDGLLSNITEGQFSNAVHIPMKNTDRVLWQTVMRQNTIVPPLRRLNASQFIRVLMYGEAVQMGAVQGGAIGRPYVEYFSDPFIIGLEDENANLMDDILSEMEQGGLPQDFYVFNTGGVGADTNEEASGSNYKKIPRELTLMLQEAVIRKAVKFEYDAILGSDIAVAIVDKTGKEVFDLRQEWLPRAIYGESEYVDRINNLKQRRYYGRNSEDKAGILRYTKVKNSLIDLGDVPQPQNERELTWLLGFFWGVDQAYDTLDQLIGNLGEGTPPGAEYRHSLNQICSAYLESGCAVPENWDNSVAKLT